MSRVIFDVMGKKNTDLEYTCTSLWRIIKGFTCSKLECQPRKQKPVNLRYIDDNTLHEKLIGHHTAVITCVLGTGLLNLKSPNENDYMDNQLNPICEFRGADTYVN